MASGEAATVYLNGLATAQAPHEATQGAARAALAEVFAGDPLFERLLPSFETAGVERRRLVAPLDWFDGRRGWAERNAAYLEGAGALFVAAARGALADAGLPPEAVDAVVTVSSTGIATPSLEARAWGEMGFRRDVERVPVFGLGCAGGVSGLSIARTLAAGRPGARVLMVAVEACSLSLRVDRGRKADVIAAMLFGDGAAATVVSTRAEGGRAGVALGEGRQRLWPDTLDIMGWEVDETGLGVVFDRSIPAFATAELAAAVEAAEVGRVDRWVLHPGGEKVLQAAEAALGLPAGAFAAERAVLREHGNMSAPTALYVLERALAEGARGRLALMALGPGFTCSILPLSVDG